MTDKEIKELQKLTIERIEEMEKLKMRELKGDDLFTLLNIVGKLDIKDEFIKMFEENISSEEPKVKPQDHKKKEPTKAEKKKELEQKRKKEIEAQKRGMKVAANLLQKVLMNANKLKVEINDLLTDLTGQDLKVIQNLKLMTYTNLMIDFFKKEELKDFFTSIASLMQQNTENLD